MMNKELFNDVFQKVVSLWPNHIVTSKKQVYEEGARVDGLFELYEDIEEIRSKDINLSSEDANQVNWAIYTVIHMFARKNDFVSPQEICSDAVYSVYLDNLSE